MPRWSFLSVIFGVRRHGQQEETCMKEAVWTTGRDMNEGPSLVVNLVVLMFCSGELLDQIG